MRPDEPEMIPLSTEGRIGWGLLFGVILGLFGLGVGAVRAGGALSGGATLSGLTEDDVALSLLFVAAFGLAGALLGALWPLRRWSLGALLLGYLGAGIVFSTLGLFMLRGADREYFVRVTGICTLFFGTISGLMIRDSR